MPKYSKNKVSDKSRDDALKIARGTQKPGQTREQTKLVAQGIQKGIEQYKKTQKQKARELDKKLNKASSINKANDLSNSDVDEHVTVAKSRLPWILLLLSWAGFAAYHLVNNYG